MQPYPHHYEVAASGNEGGPVRVSAAGLQPIDTAPPVEFDGPGNLWSPETMLVASVANCFVLTFRAICRASKFEWRHVECTVEGLLERADGVARFTRFTTHASLSVAAGTDVDKARKLLEKAEHGCLVANSLQGARELEVSVTTDG
jgi:peroxiredoxin-like protein